MTLGDVVIQEVQQEVALFLLEANNATTELRIHEQRLLTGDGMGADDWMNRCHWFTTNNASSVPAIVGLLDTCRTVSEDLIDTENIISYLSGRP